jgi:sugar transferase (PEP-CTERM/EpsH1 system associated)
VRLLYLCHRIPFPPDKGDKIRSWHEVEYLAARHEVDVFTLLDDPRDEEHVATLARHVRRLVAVWLDPWAARRRAARALFRGDSLTAAWFAEPRLRDELAGAAAAEDYDAAMVFSSNVAPLLDGIALPRVVDFVDVDSAKFRDYAATADFPPREALLRLEARRLQRLEARLAAEADATVVCAAREAEALRVFAAPRRLAVIRNGVDTEHFRPVAAGDPCATPCEMVFTGAMDYHANVDAVRWFCDEVLPRVRRVAPGARLRIVGSNPTRAVLKLRGRPGVEVTGRVADVRPHLWSARVAVAPLRVARGIQNKVLEALACGVPVVATPAALGGLERLAGAVPADGATEFANVVAHLLRDPPQRAALGAAGAAAVGREFGWATSLAHLEPLLATAASSRRGAVVEQS